MSFDQNKHNIEKDDMNIKSHLNTSLELDGISVSEDLINRTLTAIKNQSDQVPNVEEVRQPETKVIPLARIARNLTVVAAAVLIMVVGINSLGEKAVKEDQARNSIDKTAYDMATPESAKENDVAVSIAADEDVNQFTYKTDQSSKELSIDAADANQIMDTGDLDNGSILQEEAKGTSLPEVNTAFSDIYTLTFGDICPITAEAAESVNITEGVTNNSVFLSNQADIDEFYKIMNSFTFSEGAQFSGSNKYVIRINSAGASFTLSVEDTHIDTSYVYGEDRVEGKYDTSNHEALLLELDRLYLKYNQ